MANEKKYGETQVVSELFTVTAFEYSGVYHHSGKTFY